MMNTEIKTGCEALASLIRDILREGIILSPELAHHAESAFGSCTPEDVAAIIQDDDNCEASALLELIFFPDDCQKTRIEPVLQKYRFSAGDEEFILGLLQTGTIICPVRFSEKDRPVAIEVSPQVLHQFLKRLHISKQIPDEVTSLANKLPPELKWSVFIQLRQSRFDMSRGRIDFLNSFFESFFPENSEFAPCLKFIFDIFEETGSDVTMHDVLFKKKVRYLNSIRMAQETEKLMQKDNVETIIMRGIRIAPVNIEETRKKIRLLDKISYAVFREIFHGDPPVINSDLGDFTGEEGLKRMLDLL